MKKIKIKKANQINLAFNNIIQSNNSDFKDKLNLSFKIMEIMETLRKNKLKLYTYQIKKLSNIILICKKHLIPITFII